jgi:hypothetical protein
MNKKLMNKKFAVALLFSAALLLSAQSTVNGVPNQSVSSPPGWLAYYGTGADGALAITSSQNLSGIKYYTTFSCSGTTTVTANSNNQPLLIRATTSITIGAACTFVATGNSTGIGDSGGSGAGGGGGTAAGTAGNASKTITQGSFGAFASGGTAGGTTGGTGGGGNAAPASYQRAIADMGPTAGEESIVGGGAGGAGGSTGGAGGNGGGAIILIAPVINLASGSAFTSSGSAGTNSAANNTGSGGGGGGGVIIIRSPNLTDSGAVFTESGGAGGTCGSFTGCGAGGLGGAGWSVEIKQ